MARYLSITNQLVDKTARFYALYENEPIAKKAVKVLGKTLTNAALVIVGIVETLVLAIIGLFISPLSCFKSTQPNFQAFKNHIAIAAHSTRIAAKNICRNTRIFVLKDLPEEEFNMDVYRAPLKVVGTFALLGSIYIWGSFIKYYASTAPQPPPAQWGFWK